MFLDHKILAYHSPLCVQVLHGSATAHKGIGFGASRGTHTSSYGKHVIIYTESHTHYTHTHAYRHTHTRTKEQTDAMLSILILATQHNMIHTETHTKNRLRLPPSNRLQSLFGLAVAFEICVWRLEELKVLVAKRCDRLRQHACINMHTHRHTDKRTTTFDGQYTSTQHHSTDIFDMQTERICMRSWDTYSLSLQTLKSIQVPITRTHQSIQNMST